MTLTIDAGLEKHAKQICATPHFREVKRLIKDLCKDGNNCILVTSLSPGAGSTTIALALMYSIQLEQDTTSLFIDSNPFNPTLRSEQPGILDFLESDDELAHPLTKCIQKINEKDDSLRWIPLGYIRDHANELFASAKMGQTIAQLKSRYEDRLIIIDGPSVLKSAEGRSLSQYADQIVVVIHEAKTTVEEIELFKNTLPSGVPVRYVLNASLDKNLSKQYMSLKK